MLVSPPNACASAFEAAALAPDSPQIPVTVSIGVAYGLPNVAIDKIIERADAVLYRAKENGRNRVEPDQEMVVPDANAGRREQARGSQPQTAAPATVRAVPALSVPIMVR